MSQPELEAEGSSVFSSPPSSIRQMMSPKASSSPTPPSSLPGFAKHSSLPAPRSQSCTSSMSSDPLQAAPLSTTLSNLTTCNLDTPIASRRSPKRSHEEVEDENDFEHPKKFRAASSSESVIVAEQPCTGKAKALLETQGVTIVSGSSSRPSRARKPPKEFWVIDEKAQKSTQKSMQTKKPSSKVFDPNFITSNSTSRLGKADVYHMLLEDSAWTSLNRSQQKDLVSMLPPSIAKQEVHQKATAVDEDIARPRAFTLSNDCFRTDVAKFKEDLKNGHLAKTWQAAAEQAVVERASGKYDSWKAEEAELWWGQKSQ
ncbi:hypothetical protein NX059_001490 [Plenodomus lindquistii]|nr:hypothetical protein NX059_001490 [Plenodomus lindquistii]